MVFSHVEQLSCLALSKVQYLVCADLLLLKFSLQFVSVEFY